MKYSVYNGTEQAIAVGDTVKLVSNGVGSKTLYTIVDTISWNKSLYKVENQTSKLKKNVRWDNMIPVLEGFPKKPVLFAGTPKTVPAVEVGNEFVESLKKQPGNPTVNVVHTNDFVSRPAAVLELINLLNMAFSWARSPQGFEFWSNVNSELHKINRIVNESERQKKFDELNAQAQKYGFKLSKD